VKWIREIITDTAKSVQSTSQEYKGKKVCKRGGKRRFFATVWGSHGNDRPKGWIYKKAKEGEGRKKKVQQKQKSRART